jgi:ketosteroid isomerase-like protein
VSPVEEQKTLERSAVLGYDETAIKATVYAYYQAANESRWDDVVDFFHDDAVLLLPGQRPKVGREMIHRFYAATGAQFAQHHDAVALLMTDGNRVMTLIDFHGVDVRGNDVHYWTGGVFTLDGIRFRQYRVIFDTAELPEWIRRKKAAGPPPASI